MKLNLTMGGVDRGSHVQMAHADPRMHRRRLGCRSGAICVGQLSGTNDVDSAAVRDRYEFHERGQSSGAGAAVRLAHCIAGRGWGDDPLCYVSHPVR
jgi:hypothetical protein